jgi:hypothetical protein
MSPFASQLGIACRKAQTVPSRAFLADMTLSGRPSDDHGRARLNPYTSVPNWSTFGLLRPGQISSIVWFVAGTLVLRPKLRRGSGLRRLETTVNSGDRLGDDLGVDSVH